MPRCVRLRHLTQNPDARRHDARSEAPGAVRSHRHARAPPAPVPRAALTVEGHRDRAGITAQGPGPTGHEGRCRRSERPVVGERRGVDRHHRGLEVEGQARPGHGADVPCGVGPGHDDVVGSAPTRSGAERANPVRVDMVDLGDGAVGAQVGDIDHRHVRRRGDGESAPLLDGVARLIHPDYGRGEIDPERHAPTVGEVDGVERIVQRCGKLVVALLQWGKLGGEPTVHGHRGDGGDRLTPHGGDTEDDRRTPRLARGRAGDRRGRRAEPCRSVQPDGDVEVKRGSRGVHEHVDAAARLVADCVVARHRDGPPPSRRRYGGQRRGRVAPGDGRG